MVNSFAAGFFFFCCYGSSVVKTVLLGYSRKQMNKCEHVSHVWVYSPLVVCKLCYLCRMCGFVQPSLLECTRFFFKMRYETPNVQGVASLQPGGCPCYRIPGFESRSLSFYFSFSHSVIVLYFADYPYNTALTHFTLSLYSTFSFFTTVVH